MSALYAPLPAEIDSTFLDAAKPLSFSLVPASAAAEGLVEAIAGQVAEYGAAGRKRQPRKKLVDQHRAVGTITGSLLKRWGAEQPACVWHSAKTEDFTELPVGYRLFKAVQEAMIALEYVGHTPGIRFNSSGFDGGPWSGRASRMWPTEKLLALACEHGVTPDHVSDAFRLEPSSKPPVVKQLVELRGLSSYEGAKKVKGQELPLPVDDPEFIRIREGVETHNAFAASFTVEGCTPPRFYRIYTGGWQLHGRWYAAGADQTTVYLHMPERERLKLRINGEAVAEVDVSASHLSVLHGLFKLPLPDGDLYGMVPGIPREAVKAWLTVTLGRGKAKPSWSDETSEKHRVHDAGLICAKMVETYPFLAKLDEIVPADIRAAHPKGSHSLPSLVLQGIEARTLTGAMDVLRNRGILALPTHDGLIVPASAAGMAKEAFKSSFGYFAKVQPRLDVEPKERA